MGIHKHRNVIFINVLSCVVSAALMWRMACQWVAVHWTLRLARALVWFFRPTTPTASAESLSSTAPTQTTTCRPKPCPATHPRPATCEYLKALVCDMSAALNRPACCSLLSVFCRRVGDLDLEGSVLICGAFKKITLILVQTKGLKGFLMSKDVNLTIDTFSQKTADLLVFHSPAVRLLIHGDRILFNQ